MTELPTPAAWILPNGRLVGPNTISGPMPVYAVALVRRDDLVQAQEQVARLRTQLPAGWFHTMDAEWASTNHDFPLEPVAGTKWTADDGSMWHFDNGWELHGYAPKCRDVITERDAARAEVERLQASPVSPPLDSPEALPDDLLRIADRIDALGFSGWSYESYSMQIRAFARKITEALEAAAAVDADREARVKEVGHLLAKFDDIGSWEDTAAALDDLGYRLDPTRTKDGARCARTDVPALLSALEAAVSRGDPT